MHLIQTLACLGSNDVNGGLDTVLSVLARSSQLGEWIGTFTDELPGPLVSRIGMIACQDRDFYGHCRAPLASRIK